MSEALGQEFPVALTHEAGRTWLKWHRGRMRAGEMAFDPGRILQGMRVGATVEIDIQCHAQGGFVVLHDERLEGGTTGKGHVRAASPAYLRGLKLRDEAGRASEAPVALLDDLCAALAHAEIGPGALLQLDLKEEASALHPLDIASFAQAVGPVQRHVILSGGDARAVARLAQALPQMRLGYDPCHFGAREALAASGDDIGFVAQAMRDAGTARLIYLDIRLILDAQARGFDVIAAFHAQGCRIDAYTVSRVSEQMVALCKGLMARGVDQITTDDPEGLYAALL